MSLDRYSSDYRTRKAARVADFWLNVYGWCLRKCTACNGSGRYDSHRSPKCGGCDGTGKERYKGPKAMAHQDRLTQFVKAVLKT